MNMKKEEKKIRIFALVFLSLILFSITLSNIAIAQDATPTLPVIKSKTEAWCTSDANLQNNFFKARICLWFWGLSPQTKESLPAVTELIKWFLLIVVVLLCYSAFEMAKFPDNFVIRLIMSIALGFMATFFITNEDLNVRTSHPIGVQPANVQ